MRRSHIALLAVVSVAAIFADSLAAVPPVPAAPAAKETAFLIPGHASMLLTVPPGWGYKWDNPPDAPPTLLFTGADARAFSVQLTFIPVAADRKEQTTPAKVRELAERQGQIALAQSKETKLDLVELKGEKTKGYSYTLTDKSPAPGSFENMTSVCASCDDLLVVTTVLQHKKATPEQKQALAMIASGHMLEAKPDAPDMLRVDPPLGAWFMQLPHEGFEVTGQTYDPAHKVTQIDANNPKTGIIISIFMEAAPKAGDAAAVRDVYWGRAKQSPMKKDGVLLGKSGEFTTVEYITPEFNGLKVDDKNVNFYAAHEGVWIDVHMSKTGYTDADKALFDKVTSGLAFSPAAKKK